MSDNTAKKLEKSDSAFRTISEVSQSLDVQQHVLRFWETKFAQVKPVKRGGNRRYYRPEDIELLKHIHRLLYTEGYTIKGVQKLLKTQTKAELMDAARAGNATTGQDNADVTPPLTATRGPVAAAAAVQQPVVSSIRDAGQARVLRQRKILQSMLGDLVELRDNVRAARKASEG